VHLLYNFLLVLLSPLIYFVARLSPRLRNGFGERMGNFRSPATVEAVRGRAIWLHGVSVGEVKLLLPLVSQLRREAPSLACFVTAITDTGMEVLQRELGKERDVALSYFPLTDLPWTVGKFIRSVQPVLYIAAEGEAWPNLMRCLRRHGVKCILVNARYYLANKPWWKRRIAGWLFGGFDRIVCQEEVFAEAFAQLGVPSERLSVSGNIKSDMALEAWNEEQVEQFKAGHGLVGRRLLVAGSTHPGEEELVLHAFVSASADQLDWSLVLVPRHPDRAQEVAGVIAASGRKARLASKRERLEPHDVLVVDEMGVLVDYYRASDLVVLGGTFHPKVGGHNILEPALAAKPVVHGPYTDSIARQAESLRHAGAAVSVGPEELAEALKRLMRDEELRRDLGIKAMEQAKSLSGATKLTVSIIMQELGLS
jgi:3-deoxy-D-manno-octulosonic-acid transferase